MVILPFESYMIYFLQGFIGRLVHVFLSSIQNRAPTPSTPMIQAAICWEECPCLAILDCFGIPWSALVWEPLSLVCIHSLLSLTIITRPCILTICDSQQDTTHNDIPTVRLSGTDCTIITRTQYDFITKTHIRVSSGHTYDYHQETYCTIITRTHDYHKITFRTYILTVQISVICTMKCGLSQRKKARYSPRRYPEYILYVYHLNSMNHSGSQYCSI